MANYEAAMAQADDCFVNPGEKPATLEQIDKAIKDLSAAYDEVTGAEAQRATDLLESLMNLRAILDPTPPAEPMGDRFVWLPGQISDVMQPSNT